MIKLENKSAIVTGGASGIGFTIAAALADAGARLMISDINEEMLQKAQAKLQEKTEHVHIFKGDVSDFESTGQLVTETMSAFNSIDILVNNAGITRDNLLLRLSEADWDLVLRINLKGAFNMIKHASRPMMKQRSGRIINISSVVGVMGNAGQANYAASKAGMIGLTKSVAKELAGRGICCNALAPGYIQTEMTDSLPDEVKATFMKNIPLGRMGTPTDIAGVVLFLASDLGAYITGQTINIDGGMVM